MSLRALACKAWWLNKEIRAFLLSTKALQDSETGVRVLELRLSRNYHQRPMLFKRMVKLANRIKIVIDDSVKNARPTIELLNAIYDDKNSDCEVELTDRIEPERLASCLGFIGLQNVKKLTFKHRRDRAFDQIKFCSLFDNLTEITTVVASRSQSNDYTVLLDYNKIPLETQRKLDNLTIQQFILLSRPN